MLGKKTKNLQTANFIRSCYSLESITDHYDSVPKKQKCNRPLTLSLII